MTAEEEFEFEILHLMTADTHKFAIDMLYQGSIGWHQALERLQLREWIKLIDVGPVAYGPAHSIFRIFKVTDKAAAWHAARRIEIEEEFSR